MSWTPQTGFTSGSGGARSGGGSAPSGVPFDRGAARAMLEQQMVHSQNLARQAAGQPEISVAELSAADQAVIDQQLNELERTGGGLGGLGSQTPATAGTVADSGGFGEIQTTQLRPGGHPAQTAPGGGQPGGPGGGQGTGHGAGAGATGAGAGSQLGTVADSGGFGEIQTTQASAHAGGQHGAAGHGGEQHFQSGGGQGGVSGTRLQADDVDLTDIANALYDRLRTRLRYELLIDRERAGRLTDFR